ncbi:GIY-YIG nuclease family protein [Radicibacter daui]|uniref:GIY-YIG nuclease family protein n=1 Tax=Radicibacter daui TaxID=3064829 RepID=UPI004046F2B2
MQQDRKKAAIAAWKERPPAVGIYLVRCAATSECWVGASQDLEKIGNRILFSLRHGSHMNRAMQAAWNAHGAESFSVEEAERLPEEALEFGLRQTLKERLAFWCGKLGAGVA